MKYYEGSLNSKDLRVGIVVARFNDFITKQLLDGALDRLKRSGIADNDIEIAWVPGAFEIPLICKKLAAEKKYDALITLGAIIRGDTSHYDLVCSEVAKGTAQVSLEYSIPVIFGVVTTDTVEQAIDRAGTKSGNKGFEAAASAIEMGNLMKNI